jgi:hypothetical protein
MLNIIRYFILVEGLSFIIASLVHAGVLFSGYEHYRASVAEGVIGVVLLFGTVLAFIRPGWTRIVGLAVQGFALLGTMVGVFMVAIGVGPHTIPDITYHIVILAVIVWGLAVSIRRKPDSVTG